MRSQEKSRRTDAETEWWASRKVELFVGQRTGGHGQPSRRGELSARQQRSSGFELFRRRLFRTFPNHGGLIGFPERWLPWTMLIEKTVLLWHEISITSTSFCNRQYYWWRKKWHSCCKYGKTITKLVAYARMNLIFRCLLIGI